MIAISDYFQKITDLVRPRKEDTGLIQPESGISKKTPIRECPFVVFDTELSGLDANRDFIVSVGAVKMTGSIIHISREFYRLVRPSGEMSKKSVEIHGIMPDELSDQEGMDTVLPDFMKFISDSVLVGHFVNIDIKFINRAMKQRYRRKLTNFAVDTQSIHEWLYEHGTEFRKHYRGGSTKTDLFSLASFYGITLDSAHDALIDAFITAQLFQKFLFFLHAEGMQTLGELLDIGRA